ncbi:MAG: hypothetical protein CMP09_01675 [Yangia sp.]|nr:hypothetical protein [Salipiger sp.]
MPAPQHLSAPENPAPAAATAASAEAEAPEITAAPDRQIDLFGRVIVEDHDDTPLIETDHPLPGFLNQSLEERARDAAPVENMPEPATLAESDALSGSEALPVSEEIAAAPASASEPLDAMEPIDPAEEDRTVEDKRVAETALADDEFPDDSVTAPTPGSDLSTSAPDQPLTDEAAESVFSVPVPGETDVAVPETFAVGTEDMAEDAPDSSDDLESPEEADLATDEHAPAPARVIPEIPAPEDMPAPEPGPLSYIARIDVLDRGLAGALVPYLTTLHDRLGNNGRGARR